MTTAITEEHSRRRHRRQQQRLVAAPALSTIEAVCRRSRPVVLIDGRKLGPRDP